MSTFVPREKLSKRRRKELDAMRRRDWGIISPVTRKPDNPKAYARNKARKWKEMDPLSGFAVGAHMNVSKACHRRAKAT